jgi:hypothetical protein
MSSSEYDHILKENLEAMTLSLSKSLLGLSVEVLEDLSTNLPTTLERRPDLLKKVKTAQEEFVLHIEIQSSNDPNMLGRMLLYRALVYEKYRSVVRQAVFYLGPGWLSMKSSLEQAQLHFEYDLINVQEIPAQHFLSAAQPEEIILGILGDFGQVPAQEIAQTILDKIKHLPLEISDRDKYVLQLEIIAKLRGMQTLITQKIQDMAIQYNLQDDVRFKQGIEKGIDLGEYKTLKRLCHRMHEKGMPLEEIVLLSQCSEAEVLAFLAEEEDEQDTEVKA